MAINDSTSTAAVIQKVVSGIVQETLLQESILIPSIWDKTSEVGPGMGSLEIPRFSALTPATITEGTPLVSQVATIVTDKLLLNVNNAIYWSVSDRADIQSKVAITVQLVKDGAKALAATIDNTILAQLLLASAAAPDHRVQFANTTTNTIQVTDIAEARKLLNMQRVPMGDRYLLIPPAQEKAMLVLADFIDAAKYGNPDAIQNGEIGRVLGFKVLVSTAASLVDASFVAYHKSAVAYASQISAKFDTIRNVPLVADDYALSQLFGSIVLDSGKRQVLFNATGT